MAHCWRLSAPPWPSIPSHPVTGKFGADPVSRDLIISVNVLKIKLLMTFGCGLTFERFGKALARTYFRLHVFESNNVFDR